MSVPFHSRVRRLSDVDYAVVRVARTARRIERRVAVRYNLYRIIYIIV